MTIDRPALILSIILAVVLWVYVRVSQEAPMVERAVGRVRVTLVNQPTGVKATLLPADRITLSVKGHRDQVSSLTADDVKVEIDIAALRKTGTVSRIPRVALPQGIKLVGTPPAITIAVEELAQDTFPVTTAFIVTPPAGARVGEYVLSPDSVTVQGTSDALKKVKHVVVRLDPTQPMTSEVQIPPCPVDDTGERIADVTVQQASIGVHMATTTGPTGTRAVAVRPPQLLHLPRRMLVTVAAVRPDQVTISGDQATLDNQPAYLSTDPIDVSKITRDTTLTVRLRIPRGLTVVEGPTVRVDLEAERTP